MRVLLATAELLLALQAPNVLACGYCVEDKVAAAYDHAVVSHALERKHHVVFFHIDGTLPPGADTKRALEALANSTAGVDRGSARVSIETATLSFAFDPKRAPIGRVHRELERKLVERKLSLMPLRVMESPGTLTAVHRR